MIEHGWGFGPDDIYEVGDTFKWAADSGDVYCAPKFAAQPYGTYIITRKDTDPYGRNWYEASLLPEDPTTKEHMLEISS